MHPDLLPYLASSFEHYLTLERVHPERTYNYAKRGFSDLPVIEVSQHRAKCKQGDSWMYVATPLGAELARLRDEEKLYVGAQTQDRMFRGDGLDGNNYHHGEMRAGNGQDNPVAFLKTGRRIGIHRVAAHDIAKVVSVTPELSRLKALLQQPRTPRKHVGYWFEQYIIHSQRGKWRWNTASADRALEKILSQAASGGA